MTIFGVGGLVAFIVFIVILSNLRKVVPTNEVHIAQGKKTSKAYGRGFDAGNVYIDWPSWVPALGVEVQKLPISIFTIKVDQYKAYDSGKVPFIVDVTAFFVIKEPEIAAQKIFHIEELKEHLNETLKGVIRKTLASKDIIEIMESRVEIKEEFYKEVLDSVVSWGVDLKNVEFMDIRDPETGESRVISNIMQKKRSEIESESQIEVSENQKRTIIEKENKESEARARAAEAKSKADIVEYDSQRESGLKKLENERVTENFEIEKEEELNLKKEISRQKMFEAQKSTREKELMIEQLEEERNAEISKRTEIIKAEEIRDRRKIEVESEKYITETNAEAERLKIESLAEAEAKRIQSLAEAKAREVNYIGTAEARNKEEMAEALNKFKPEALNFMIKQLEADISQVVDLEKARALNNADIKIVSTGDNGTSGINSFMDLFSSNGGANIGAMVETFKKTVGEEKFNNIVNNFKQINDKQEESV
ncbi:SPFH domain-containing protein [Candidatus Vampirococcus lugosii]|uniref:SPFH domain-containing protein n=1 Tax=Candidatus Vampirococcus lugosii TaxID=2789015 RepID=A0ABS5QMI2_9BACT|nr:SPFH domain-containing protein [Candidatus Vampirococcus lugosii]MBS8122277.1 SPFH domain-containing protein [Candidatus Vampirococcus lugosii]